MPVLRSCLPGLLLAAFLISSGASAQGFQLQQHEPAAPGDGFFGVRAPRYDAAHALVVGLTFNYGHNPLLGGHVDGNGNFVADRVVISDQLVGHLDISGALFGRLQLSASLPVTLLERGDGGFGVSPVGGAVVGDPRFGARVRLFGEERAPFRAHVGGDLWIPVGVADRHAGDAGLRGQLGVIFDGRATSHLRWAANAGVLLRQRSALNLVTRGHGTVGNALQAAVGVAYAAPDDRYRVGPELIFSTGLDETVLTSASTRMELLLGGGYRIADVVEIGPAVGFGLVRSVGTPDVRALLRIAILPFGGRDDSPPEDAQASESAPEEETVSEDSAPTEEEEEPVPEPEPEPQPEPVEEEVVEEEVETAPEPEPVEEEIDDASDALQPGAILVTVNFASDSDVLDADALAALDRAIAETGGIHNVRLTLEGHGDSNGPERWNEVLSELRARSVERHLRQRGIPASNLSVRGFGSQRPVQSNDTASGRAANRRVEVRVESLRD
ncbi:MAG TPA: OmpA family protein [Myxococcaceae bacterium]|nr:OmpA family protein [Myxococcaceae bacterium]